MIRYEELLNEQQLQVVTNGDGPTLVLAGAGSGKTRTIVYRVAWLLEHGVSPSSILLVTFTNKAASEMRERLEGLVGSLAAGIWMGTFHSVANRLLRLNATQLGYDVGFTILDQDDQLALLKQCIKERKIRASDKRFPSARVLLHIISFAANAQQSIREVVEQSYGSFELFIPELEAIADRYREKKFEANSMDFDDMLAQFLRLLIECEPVARRLAEQFQFVLVDEYQDTNTIQAKIVQRISAHHRNLLVVGDDAQSIYSFRAATVRNILDFPDQFPDAKTYRLEVNYRSTPQILELANTSILQNEDQFQKTLRAAKDGASIPVLMAASTGRAEAQYIADRIEELIHEGMAAREIAILFRAAYQSQALEFELMKRGVSYEYRGGTRFFERSHIKDATAFLRLLENPKDEAAWLRILNLQQGIGPATAQKIFVGVRGKDHEEWLSPNPPCKLSVRALAGWKQAQEMLQPIVEAKTISDKIRGLSATPYIDYLESQYPNATDRLSDIRQLARFSQQYEDLSTFLADTTLSESFGAILESDQPFGHRIVMSTIHQAKGLEWDAVFVISLMDGYFPNRRAMNEEDGLEEERRLFYVAVTRAREKLFLTHAMTSMGEGMEPLLPSLFVQELPSAVLSRQKLHSRGVPDWRSPQQQRRPTTVFHEMDQGAFSDEEEAVDVEEPRSNSGFLKNY